MPVLTLPSRQRLSRRVLFFGDKAGDYRQTLHEKPDLKAWERSIMLDPEGQSIVNYMANNAAAPDLFPMPIPAEYLQYLSDIGQASQPAFQDAPVTTPSLPAAMPSNTGILNPPGMTNEEYAAMVEKNKADAAGLATQNALRTNQEPAFQVDPPVTTNNAPAPVTESGKVEAEAKKSNSLILPAAFAVAAFLFLKG